MGMDQDGSLIWQQKLTSPVVSAWRVLGGEVEDVDLFSTSSIPALTPDKARPDSGVPKDKGGAEKQPALYVGVHQQQLYIQQSHGMHHKLNTAARLFTAEATNEDGALTKYPRVQWRPYLASAPSRTPIVNHNTRHHPLLLSFDGEGEPNTAVALTHHVDYPFDNGYYLYADDTNAQLNLSRPWNRPANEEAEEDTLMDDMTSQIMHICFHIGPSTWFKLGMAVGCYALLHYLLLRYMAAYMRRQLTRQALVLVTQMFNLVLQNNPQILALMQRMGIQFQALPPPPPPPQPPPPQEGGGGKALPPPTPPQDTPAVKEKAETSTEYTSRYLTDFEVVQRLGRGGFGVVCQVRNKLDENEYAVKRINLPTNKSSAERVKREVRALAKLNHSNIVRYYNSWLETPPPGWHDPQDNLHTGDVLSMSSLFSPATDESHQEMAPPVPTHTSPLPAPLHTPPEDTGSLGGVLGRLGGAGGLGKLGWTGGLGGLEGNLTGTWNDGLSGYVEDDDSDGNDDDSDENDEDNSENDDDSDDEDENDDSKNNIWNNSQDQDQDCSFDIVFEHSHNSVELVKEDLCTRTDVHSADLTDTDSDGAHDNLTDTSSSCAHSQQSWEKVSSHGLSHSIVFEDSENSHWLKNDKENGRNKENGKTNEENARNDNEKARNDKENGRNCKESRRKDKENSKTTTKENVTENEAFKDEPKKRRRVKSQPGQNKKKEERPRTLSLGCTTADKLKNTKESQALVKETKIPRTFLYIQMELCQKESLRDWLMENTERNIGVVVDMFNDVINAVEYVHDNHLMHRDLKPSNIFFSLEGKVKVGDFGLVTTIAEEEEEQQAYTPATHLQKYRPDRAHTHRVGTRLYMSPEQLSGQIYDYKVDIYSLGLILFEMLVPFGTGMERLTVMTTLRDNLVFPPLFEDQFPDESSLLKLMLSRDPACRPTTRGLRARKPFRPLQGRGVEDICPEDHFRLSRQRSHFTSSSSSNPSLSTSSVTSI